MRFSYITPKVRKANSGLTLIELIVASAISVMIMGVAVTILLLLLRSFDTSTKQTQAHNLCVMTVQKIDTTLRYSKTVTISNTDSGDGIYYDPSSNGIHIGSSTYLGQTFKGYKVYFVFSNIDTTKNNLLGIKMTVKSKDGNATYYTLNSKVCLLNGSINSTDTGDSIQYSDS